MRTSLKQTVREKLDEKRLTEQQLDALMSMQEGAVNDPEARATSKSLVRWRVTSAVLAACALILTVLLLLPQPEFVPQSQRIADEVALNHVKLKPLEVQSDDIAELREYFTELDFSPVATNVLPLSRYRLLGGRYCSIEGQPAAQLRLLDPVTGEIHSLYQTQDSPLFVELDAVGPKQGMLERKARGMTVDIWKEEGLVFALTRESDSRRSD